MLTSCNQNRHDDQEYMLKREIEPAIRQRADPEKIKHFVNWLVESNTLVSGWYKKLLPNNWNFPFLHLLSSNNIGTYELTTLCMDNGEKYQVPKQILQLQKTHALLNYKKYCDGTDFESLSYSKLYDILNGIKPAQQQAVSGLDEFVVQGDKACRVLSSK